MPKSPKTDLQILRAILSMPQGKLTTAEKSAFQGMYDSLATGNQSRLSMRQRAWTEEVYDKHDLDKERPPVKKVAIRDKSLLTPSHPMDALPRPLKPPTKIKP